MDKEIKVSSLTIDIGKRELSLTLEEARSLKRALDELFKEKTIVREKVVEHQHHYDNWPRGNVWLGGLSTASSPVVGFPNGNQSYDYLEANKIGKKLDYGDVKITCHAK